MVEAAYKIAQIISTQCKDGRRFQELVCVGADNHIIRVLLPVTNNCEYLPFGESHECSTCEHKDTCEITAPCEVVLGRKLVIVDLGEVALTKQ